MGVAEWRACCWPSGPTVDMAKFLFTVWPIAGHFYPQIAIAQALRDRGHECAFYTGDKMAGFLQSEGFRHFGFRKMSQERLFNTLFAPERGAMDRRRPWRFMSVLRNFLLETIPAQVEDLEPALDEWRPDAIASDPTVWSPMLVFHEQRRIPVAISSFCPAAMIPGPQAPPFGWGLPRPRDWKTRLLSRVAYRLQDLMAVNFRKRANDLRRRYGLPDLKVPVLAHSGAMPLYLVPSTPELDFNRTDLPASVHYVGPLFRKQPPDDHPPEWLERLPRERPWIYVTEGTVHVSDPLVIRAAVQGLSGLPLEMIVISGDDRDPAQLGIAPLAPNVHLDRWISYSHVLRYTKVMVTTGGPGSVLAALCNGIPVLIIPTEWDKPDIAQRLVDTGAGICLPAHRCTPKNLRAAVERLLTQDSYARNARRMSRVLDQYSGPSRAADLLEQLAEGRRRQRPAYMFALLDQP